MIPGIQTDGEFAAHRMDDDLSHWKKIQFVKIGKLKNGRIFMTTT